MKNDAKFQEDLTCQFKIDIRNLTNFEPSTQKSQKCALLMGCFWPKYIMFELKKVQRSYVWLHLILMQNLKENWLVLSKITWRIWQIVIHRLKNGNFILESKMAELNEKKKFQNNQIDQMQCENFIYLRNKWIAQLINKTFYTCSAESLFLRNKISKKAVKLGSFLQFPWWLRLKN